MYRTTQYNIISTHGILSIDMILYHMTQYCYIWNDNVSYSMIQFCFLYYDFVSYVVSYDIVSYNFVFYDIVLIIATLSNTMIEIVNNVFIYMYYISQMWCLLMSFVICDYIFIFQLTAYPVENKKLSDILENENTVEQEPFLRIGTEDSSESPPTIKHEDENIPGARKSG